METEHYIPPLGEQILSDFKRYHEEVGPTLYFTGNHDCWTLGHLAECGFRVHAEPKVIPVGNKKILLFHGDGAESLGTRFRRPLLQIGRASCRERVEVRGAGGVGTIR